MTALETKYQTLVDTPSDINEHLPTLRQYASECQHITEMGVRYVVSTFALMAGRPQTLVSIDKVHPDDVVGGVDDAIKGKDEFALAQRCAIESGVRFQFVQGLTELVHIEPTELLFIDTQHTYTQLKTELERHHAKVSKYILLHDTTSFGNRDEVFDESRGLFAPMGLRPAITEFLEAHPEWVKHEEQYNQNGLTVLKRAS